MMLFTAGSAVRAQISFSVSADLRNAKKWGSVATRDVIEGMGRGRGQTEFKYFFAYREPRLHLTAGFYEWKKPEMQPYAVAMADESLMVMAGLWDEWTDKKTGECIKSCTIITCPPNALIGSLHHWGTLACFDDSNSGKERIVSTGLAVTSKSGAWLKARTTSEKT
jgi:hypothetical protein